jgi:hypothetical protein
MKFPRLLTVLAAIVGLLADDALPTPASAAMLITFTATDANYATQQFIPMSGSFTFDPALGTVTAGSIFTTYRGPISATVQIGANSYSFANSGKVQFKDNFPKNPNDCCDDPDLNDWIDVIMSASVATGPQTTHDDSIRLFAEEFHQDFIHGLSLTQSFDVISSGGNDGYDHFFDGERQANDVPEPGFVDIYFELGEVHMHAVPEPSSAALLLTALALAGFAGGRRVRMSGRSALLGISSVLLLSLALPAQAFATVLITFTGTAFDDGGGPSFPTPLSGTITVHPELATTVLQNSLGSRYAGGDFISATVQFGGQSFTFGGDGVAHDNFVQLLDNFPRHTNDDPDANDFIQLGIFTTTPVGPGTTHNEGLSLFEEEFHQDFVHGPSIFQTLDVMSSGNNGFESKFFDVDVDPSIASVIGPLADFTVTEVHMRTVPEPSSALTLLTALGGLIGMARRRRF